jgi:murein DD-endopeptidase MepM/ murein hydrolase activator NlpD
MWRWFKWLLLGIGSFILVVSLLLIQPWVFLPHKHIQVSLPFSAEIDQFTAINPAGETDDHPNGHQGVDYAWHPLDKQIPIFAVADGWILWTIKRDEGYDIEQSLGFYYRTVYRELESIEPNIKTFSKVKKGQLLGYSQPNFQIHWELASSSILIRHLCPLNYYDSDSRKRVEAIWLKTLSRPNNKYPEICINEYKGKED